MTAGWRPSAIFLFRSQPLPVFSAPLTLVDDASGAVTAGAGSDYAGAMFQSCPQLWISKIVITGFTPVNRCCAIRLRWR
jgi:hypothetical protein